MMKKLTADDPQAQSADVVAENIAQLAALFPDTFTEGKVDFDVLKQLLGAAVEEREEKYGLNWHGKRAARRLALTPSLGTLRPCPDESVDWDATQNLMIEGDNLEVLKLLQKSYSGKVKLIYIDPPYNSGGDFVYQDDFQDNIKNYLMLTGQIATDGRKMTSNTEASGRFHTDWLNMMYPRLKLAHSLLRPDGVMFVSIDDTECASLRLLLSEVFGEENLMGTLIWKNATDNNPTNIATEHEYILVVSRSREALEAEWKSALSDVKDVLIKIGDELTAKYKGKELDDAYEEWYRKHKPELWPLDRYKYIDNGGVYTGSQSVHNPGREGYRYDVPHPKTKKPCKQPLLGYRFPRETMDELLAQKRVLFGEDENKIIELKIYAREFNDKLASVIELDGRLGAYDLKEDFPVEGKVFNNTKPIRLLNAFFPYLVKSSNDIVLDFFAGSGATGRAVYTLNEKDGINRRYILVQLPEPLDPEEREQKAAFQLCAKMKRLPVLSEVTKERLRRAGTTVREKNPLFKGDVGFRVFKLDSSNIQAWEPNREDIPGTLAKHLAHLKVNRTEHDILFELLLKLGLDLTVPIEKKTITGKTAYSIGSGALMVCLAEKIATKEVEPLALGMVEWHRKLAPAGDTTVVFRDSAFADDVAKTNLTAILQQSGLDNVRSL